MTDLRAAALTVSVDEPAIRLTETVRRVLNERGHTEDRRYQHILVIRNDVVHEYVEDLGLASCYPGEAFIIIADAEPVGELLDMAFCRRWARPYVIEAGIPPPNLAEGWRQAAEKQWKQHLGQSVFGPAFRKQRDN